MENLKKLKLDTCSTSQSQPKQELTAREKFYEETIIIEQTQQKPEFRLTIDNKVLQEWPIKINNNIIHLNNLNYLKFCFQKTEVLLKESKNINAPVPISKTSELRWHIYDLEELLEYNFTKKFKPSIEANISALKRIIKCI